MILIVASNRDPASLNIKKQILTQYSFKERAKFQENLTYAAQISGRDVQLVTLNAESIHAQDLTSFFTQIELVVFISRHSSTAGTPTLSVHTPGNLGEAQLGGNPKEVSVSPANAMRDALKTMEKLRREMHLDYQVSYEGTHHGPSLNVPAMFAELGSTPEQWNDAVAARVVAHATIEAVERFGLFPAKAVLGAGGPHYNGKFTRIALESEVAFGHIIPKHSVAKTDSELLKQCVDRTLEKVDQAVLDWKGIKAEDKPGLIQMLKEIDVQIQKV